MKKMTKKDANEIYKIAKASLNRIEKITYAIGEADVDVDIYTRLSLADIRAISIEVILASYVDGQYDEFYKKAQLSKCIIDYMTSLPLPMVKNEDGTSNTDLNLCYEIVFGKEGLVDKSEFLKDEICSINHFIDSQCKNLDNSTTATERLCQKILDLYEILKSEIADVTENPVRLLELIDKLPDDQFGDTVLAMKDKLEVIK